MTDQIATYFFNWLPLHAAGLVSAVLIFDRVFDRRRSMLVWALYFIPRAIIRAYLSSAIAAGDISPGLLTFDVIFIMATAVMSFAVLWYTWDAEPLKIGIAGVVSDLLTSMAMVIAVSAVNYAAGGGFTPSITSLSFVMAAAAGTALVLLVLAMMWLLRPVTEWFARTEFRHRRLLTAVVIFGAAVFSTTNLNDTEGFNSSVFIVCMTAVLLLLPLMIYILKTIGTQNSRRTLLRQQADMTSAYILAVDSQTGSLAEHRQLLDTVAERIESAGDGLRREELGSYIAELRERADSLRSGSYSSNIALDAVLTAFAGRFEALGCRTALRADAVDEDDTRAAEMSWILLNWAEKTAARGQTDSVAYSLLKRSGQLMARLTMECRGRPRFPERLLDGLVGRSDIIDQSRGGDGSYELKVMTGAGPAEAQGKEAE